MLYVSAIAVLVVLPLGLLRNVDSLSAVSAITITFYICLVLKVVLAKYKGRFLVSTSDSVF